MIPRALLGTSIGGGIGALYGSFGHCVGGHCLVQWSPWPPALLGAGLGLFIVLTSQWD